MKVFKNIQKLLKIFKRVSLNKATWAWMFLPSKAFSQLKDSIAWVYCYNVGVAIIPNQTLMRRRVKYFHINLWKYYLVVAVLVERRMYSTICYHVWLISKNQIYARRRWWKNVSWLIDYLMKSVKGGNWFKSCTFNIVNITRPLTGRSRIEITCY